MIRRWGRDIEDTLGFVVVIVVIGAVIIVIANAALRHSCNRGGDVIGFEAHYGFFEGCFYEVAPGTWVPREHLRENDVYRERS